MGRETTEADERSVGAMRDRNGLRRWRRCAGCPRDRLQSLQLLPGRPLAGMVVGVDERPFGTERLSDQVRGWQRRDRQAEICGEEDKEQPLAARRHVGSQTIVAVIPEIGRASGRERWEDW